MAEIKVALTLWEAGGFAISEINVGVWLLGLLYISLLLSAIISWNPTKDCYNRWSREVKHLR